MHLGTLLLGARSTPNFRVNAFPHPYLPKKRQLLIEMRLRQALQSSIELGVPNTFRIAIVCDAFERVAPFTGRLEGLLDVIWRELTQAIYSDYTKDLPGAGAKTYAERVPYFLEAKRLREMLAAAERRIRQMKAQREAEKKALEGQNNVR